LQGSSCGVELPIAAETVWGVLQKLTAGMIACCVITAFVWPGWSFALTRILFAVFGATAVGWSGFFLAEIARCSPRGQVGLAKRAARGERSIG